VCVTRAATGLFNASDYGPCLPGSLPHLFAGRDACGDQHHLLFCGASSNMTLFDICLHQADCLTTRYLSWAGHLRHAVPRPLVWDPVTRCVGHSEYCYCLQFRVFIVIVHNLQSRNFRQLCYRHFSARERETLRRSSSAFVKDVDETELS
jgi:hypothetical protein